MSRLQVQLELTDEDALLLRFLKSHGAPDPLLVRFCKLVNTADLLDRTALNVKLYEVAEANVVRNDAWALHLSDRVEFGSSASLPDDEEFGYPTEQAYLYYQE